MNMSKYLKYRILHVICCSTKLNNNSEGNNEKIYFGNNSCALILRLGFEYVRSPFIHP